MAFDIARWVPDRKQVDVVIVGDTVDSDLAREIIRRTDGGFPKRLGYFRPSEYGLLVRRLVGYPIGMDAITGEKRHWTEVEPEIARWRERWRSIDLSWLGNWQVMGGQGWCWPDGSICFAGEPAG